jgi:alanyl-tRNA synthetase
MNGNSKLFEFFKSEGHNSVKNGSIIPKTELDLDIINYDKSVYQSSFQYLQPVQKKLIETG